MKYIIIIFVALSFVACEQPNTSTYHGNDTDSTKLLPVPDWSKNANIYEVNIRQYTPEGTFNAFAEHLPRLKEMGVDILWLMPVYPISEKNRKGTLGSYYAVQDYKAINPNFGTEEDFRKIVEQTHSLGMKLILDWVPNHTGFDNVWIEAHPEWYTKDEDGNITHPKDTDWTDVADLNYDNMEMREAMTDAMIYWIKEFDIDGYRCDVAGFVPNDFWASNNTALFSSKAVFMLAEWEDPTMHDVGFHMTYGWEFHHILNNLAQGKTTLTELDEYVVKERQKYKAEDYRMNFITNHDENSWNGTIEERLGDAADVLAILAFTIDGMPLVYSGQEAGLNKRLAFFEKDSIDWTNYPKQDFYTKLLKLKHENKALWNGIYGGNYHKISTSNDDNIFAFYRNNSNDKLIVVLNLSNENQEFTLTEDDYNTEFTNLFTSEKIVPATWKDNAVSLEAWSYLVLSRN